MRKSIWNLIGCVVIVVTLLGCNGSSDTTGADDTTQGSDSGDSTGETEQKSETEKIEDDIPIPNLNETLLKTESSESKPAASDDASKIE